MTKKQHYMTREERYKLEALLEANVPVAKIAKQLGFCRQTIYNELERGECDVIHDINGYLRDLKEYSADKAQQVHNYNQTAKGRPLKIGNDREYANYLEGKMLGVQEDGSRDRRKRFSPAAALASARSEGYTTSVCTTTLYSYIKKRVFLRLTEKDLWHKSKEKKGQKEKRIAHPKWPNITDRPEIISQRLEPGHWEMDLVVGKSGSSCVLLTLTERLARQELIFKLPDKKAATVRGVFDRLERTMPNFRQRFKSITTDNGSEFLQYDQLRNSIYEGTRFDVYYCHSYAAWEKGSNENHNRMIRRWFPKGTDFGPVPVEELVALQDWMNDYPRKCLGWKTPNEAAT